MRLETSETKWDTVDDATIVAAVDAVARGDADFVILDRGDSCFIQAAPGWVLEHQAGSVDQHFKATRKDLTTTDIVAAMQLYAHGDEAWRSVSAWKPLNVRVAHVLFNARLVGLILLLLASIGYSLWKFL